MMTMNPLQSSSLRALRALRKPWPQSTPSQVRYFHPTKPASGLISTVLDASTGLVYGVHTVTYLPWVLSLPLTAVVVRTFVGMPIQFWTRFHARRAQDVSPLIHSWRVHYEKEGVKMGLTPPQISKLVAQRAALIHKGWKVNNWVKASAALQIPVWIALMESIRGMCGSTSGLVPWLLSLTRPTKESADEAIQSLNLAVEPSLATEGALWFPDLLAGDSTGILPCILGASILLNVNRGWKSASFKEMSEMPKLQMYQNFFFGGLRAFIQVLAINVALSGWYYEMPTALLVYWITSTNVATLQTWWLGKYMFSRPSIPAYKSMHVKYEKEGDPFRLKLK